VEISVRVRGAAVEVAIRAQEPEARMALLASRDQLDVALVARELRVESLEIRSAEPRPQGDTAFADRPAFGESPSGHESESGRAREEARQGSRNLGTAQTEPSPRPHTTQVETPRGVDLHV
jgi:hypothetical protein